MKTQTTKRRAARSQRVVRNNSAALKNRTKRKQTTAGFALRVLLVPVDFSTSSLHALECAEALAERSDASIKLLHVLDPMYVPGRFDSPRLRPLRAEALEDARLKLAKLAKRGVKSHVPVRHQVLKGIAYSVIVEEAAKGKVDMIVMGSSGRTGMSRFLVGSVAEKVIRHAPCPVLIVRDKAG
jgi:universal stress protein A